MSKKSKFIHGILYNLKEEHQLFHNNIKKVFDNLSIMETIAHLPASLSDDGKQRSLVLSRAIIDKINLIKTIPNSENYLLIAANRDNGFYAVTHFETETSDHINLQRLLGRGSVVSRGAILMPDTTNQDDESAREGI